MFRGLQHHMDEVTVLFRPVGQKELDLIRESGFAAFPPRLPEQPIWRRGASGVLDTSGPAGGV